MGAAVLPLDAEWGECLVPATAVPPEMEAAVRRAYGAVPGWLGRLAPCGWIVRTLMAFHARPLAYAPDTLCDLVSLVVSQDNSCRYCYGVQRAVLRIHGFSDETIDRLLRDFHVAETSPADRAALEFARRLTRATPRPGRAELDAVVEAGMRREAVVEVAAVAAAANFFNRLSTFLALPPEPFARMPERPAFRLLRPLLAWRMRRRPAEPVREPVPRDGPCAAVVAALGDAPIAATLRRVFDDAWASDVLPRRTKALVLGVVGRALGCPHAERESRDFLAGEGFAPAELDEVFATLRCPRLDPREARLVPFARETVRYQPVAIQERLRRVAEGFAPEETIETVGILALANAVCRLSVVLDAC